MTGQYAYTPYIWPMLASLVLLLPPAVHAWRHRSAPGALPFMALVSCIAPWAIGAAVEMAALEPATRIFWFEFQGLWQLPAALWFAAEHADLGRSLSGRALAALAVPPPCVAALVLGGSTRPLLCAAYSAEASVHCVLGPAGRLLTAWGSAWRWRPARGRHFLSPDALPPAGRLVWRSRVGSTSPRTRCLPAPSAGDDGALRGRARL